MTFWQPGKVSANYAIQFAVVSLLPRPITSFLGHTRQMLFHCEETELSFFTSLPCPLTATKVTLMYIPGKGKTIL